VSIRLALHLATIQQRPTLIQLHLKSHDKNNKENRYCRIGNRRFWAPCALRHRPTNVDGIGRDSRFRPPKQMRVDFDRLALSRYRNRSNASPRITRPALTIHCLATYRQRTRHCICALLMEAERLERVTYTREVVPHERSRRARFSPSLTKEGGYLVSAGCIRRNSAASCRSVVVRQCPSTTFLPLA
jgi:hypothetical protein